MALLVGPGHHVQPKLRTAGIGREGPRELKGVDDPQRPVEPAAIGLGFAVRADQ